MECNKRCSECPGTSVNAITGDYICKAYARKAKEDKLLRFYFNVLKININKIDELILKRAENKDKEFAEFYDNDIANKVRYINKQVDRILGVADEEGI